jgi:hypothetical protein
VRASGSLIYVPTHEKGVEQSRADADLAPRLELLLQLRHGIHLDIDVYT